MKLKALLLLIAPLAACGSDLCEGSDWKTSQGICVFTNGFNIDKDKLSYSIDTTEDFVAEKHPSKYNKGRLNDSYDSVSMEFVGYVSEKADGYTAYEYGPFVRDNYKIVSEVHDDECFHYVWIIPHELMHLYLIDIGGKKYKEAHIIGWHWHPDFTPEENASSLQYAIFRKLWCDLCGIC